MQINQYLEYTRLNPDLTQQQVDSMVSEAVQAQILGVCVPPFWLARAFRERGDSPLKLVTVVGFPLGYDRTETKQKACEMAVKDGADEVDLVWNVSAFKSGMSWPKVELAKCAQQLHEAGVVMKVILETSLLTQDEIVEASKLAVDAGADYIKTSTGFGAGGALVSDIRLIRASVPEHVGVKASGGIKTYHQTVEMIRAGADRIGTSSAMNILGESEK
jgi:deoxyribose-phosphate aldolase